MQNHPTTVDELQQIGIIPPARFSENVRFFKVSSVFTRSICLFECTGICKTRNRRSHGQTGWLKAGKCLQFDPVRRSGDPFAGVAQLVEHHVANVVVEGSSPFTRFFLLTSGCVEAALVRKFPQQQYFPDSPIRSDVLFPAIFPPGREHPSDRFRGPAGYGPGQIGRQFAVCRSPCSCTCLRSFVIAFRLNCPQTLRCSSTSHRSLLSSRTAQIRTARR